MKCFAFKIILSMKHTISHLSILQFIFIWPENFFKSQILRTRIKTHASSVAYNIIIHVHSEIVVGSSKLHGYTDKNTNTFLEPYDTVAVLFSATCISFRQVMDR